VSGDEPTPDQLRNWADEVVDYVRRGLSRPPGEPWEVSTDELTKAVAAMPDGLRTKAVKVAYVRRGGMEPDSTYEAAVETFLWAGWSRADDDTLRRDVP